MNGSEPTGYENEPEERFLPLPDNLYSKFYHRTVSPPDNEGCYYLNALQQYHCRKILELGCGTGRISEFIQQRGLQVIGIDTSREMLTFARRSRQSPVVEMDMCQLGFTSCFDAVIVPCNTLNLLVDQAKISGCLREIKRVLKVSGLLLLHLFVPNAPLQSNSGKRFFQFALFDMEDGGKLIKESIRTYDQASHQLSLEERFKIRPFQARTAYRNYRHRLTLTAKPPEFWLRLLEKAGFSVVSSTSSFTLTPFQPGRDAMFLVSALSNR